MTLTPEQIKEAVGLADGFEPFHEGIDVLTEDGRLLFAVDWDDVPQCVIAALASQLISQVRHIAREAKQPWLYGNIITELRRQGLDTEMSEFLVLACTEFLREKEHLTTDSPLYEHYIEGKRRGRKIREKGKEECQACIGFDGEHTCEGWDEFQEMRKERDR